MPIVVMTRYEGKKERSWAFRCVAMKLNPVVCILYISAVNAKMHEGKGKEIG